MSPGAGPAAAGGPPAPPAPAARGLAFRDLDYPLETRMARVAGADVAYADEGAGPLALVLIHGLASYLPAWARNVRALAERHRVVALDLPGFGKSSKVGHPLSMAYFADVVDGLAGALGLGRFALVGHSMGGQVALAHALARPGRAEALVLSAPAGLEAFSAAEARLLAAAVPPEAVAATPAEVVYANLALNFVETPPEARFMGDDRVRVIGGPDLDDYARAVSRSVAAMLAEPVLGRLGEVRVPTLVVFGEGDALIPNRVLHRGSTRALAEAAVARLPRGRLVMLERAGHMPHFERPDAWNAAALDFLAAL
ncbi:MAG TPA: alpha/beta fold hydrolase [Polyangiaceae bacterium]|nr:alpha/beta fold hydrolase [Polyangiaceae bacterium]